MVRWLSSHHCEVERGEAAAARVPELVAPVHVEEPRRRRARHAHLLAVDAAEGVGDVDVVARALRGHLPQALVDALHRDLGLQMST